MSLELADLYSIRAPRVAVQLLGAVWGAVTLAAVVVTGRDARVKGLVFPLWLALYAVGSFGLGFVRTDQMLLVAGWRAGQVADLALTLMGAAMFTVGLFGKRRVRRIANPPYDARPNRIGVEEA